MEKKIRILQVLNSLGMGGIESLATDILKNINKDEFEVDFCIMEGKDTNRLYDVQNLGAKVYYYPKLNFKSIFKFKKWWRDFFKSHQYDIVHGHVFTSASLYLPIAKKFGMHTNEIIISLSFTSDKAYCSAEISGAIGTTSITDCTVTLTDSKGNEVKSWSGLSAVGYRLIVVETAQGVKKGETYTLSVTATVNRDGRSETVSDSFTRTYN